jgi:chromosome segregation ATPase
MNPKNYAAPLLFILLALSALSPAVADDQSANIENRLREALRNAMIQARDAQTQVVALQAAQAQSDKDKADLQAKIDTLTAQLKSANDQAYADKASANQTISDLKSHSNDLVKQLVDALTYQINALTKPSPEDKAILEKTLADLKNQNPDVGALLDQYGTDIQLWKVGYYQYVQLAQTTEAARRQLAQQNATLQRLVDDRERKNFALYKVGSEILTRYEQFGLGDALAAKEPFTGIYRVKLETLV